MRVHISTFDGRVDELRALIERNRQMSTTQTEVLALLRQERHARVASQTDLEERTRRLEVDLAAMSRRLDTLSRRFIRQKESNANNKDDEQQRLRANIAAEKEKQNRIKDVTQHILDSIKCFEAEQTPTWSKPNTVSELEHSRPLYVKEKADPCHKWKNSS
ncbi:hypothetical protein BGW39_003630 [Mortierella sp. 14UC]|nr:hypothetical protein BGW39_003630 [Mortierella sp. 14UC]